MPCSCPYTSFFALKRPCNGPLILWFFCFFEFGRHIGPIVGPGHPPFIPACARTVSDFPKYAYYAYIYLRGVRLKDTKKKNLYSDELELYSCFEKVSEVKKRHEIPHLPPQYLYLLVCCFKEDCPHPLCQDGKNGLQMHWFENGPEYHKIPLPIPDPNHSWGNSSCTICSGFCAGHILTPEEALQSTLTPMAQPPSTLLKQCLDKFCDAEPSEYKVEDIARRTFLLVEEVDMWLEHLRTVDKNRKCGSAKALKVNGKGV